MLAMAVSQVPEVLDFPAPSPAGRLPQGLSVSTEIVHDKNPLKERNAVHLSGCTPCGEGGLSDRRTAPSGCEAVVKPLHAVPLINLGGRFWGRSAANGGKPPRHKCVPQLK